MIHFYHFSLFSKNIFSQCKLSHPSSIFCSFLFLVIFFFISCTPAERFAKKEVTGIKTSELRILLNDFSSADYLNVESSVYLTDEANSLTQIQAGNKVNSFIDNGNIIITVNGRNFTREKFFLNPAGNDAIIKINGKRYRGKIQISSSDRSIDLINIVNLEDYVKGVLAKEMPLGKNNENFEALKALAVCVRTYAVRKSQDGKVYFDLYDDTHDQVYGGVDAENPLSNKAAKETENLILKYQGEPALLYYHSTCGGYTESSENVFTANPVPYLKSIKDGDDPYCKISTRFQWEESYTKDEIIYRLKDYSLLNEGNYELKDFSVVNRFESGRVAELEIKVVDEYENEKTLVLKGNEIRSILRTSDNKNILWSTMFDLSIKSDSVVLTGKGFGHGVGLCEWGAIALSRKGWNYKDILQHYYPGTSVGIYND